MARVTGWGRVWPASLARRRLRPVTDSGLEYTTEMHSRPESNCCRCRTLLACRTAPDFAAGTPRRSQSVARRDRGWRSARRPFAPSFSAARGPGAKCGAFLPGTTPVRGGSAPRASLRPSERPSPSRPRTGFCSQTSFCGGGLNWREGCPSRRGPEVSEYGLGLVECRSAEVGFG
jgi:hypothetical protein